jgi:polar amino acid transport system ATP-binding protein
VQVNAQSSAPAGLPAAGALLLDVRALRKSFGTVEVLKGVDLSVAARELVFIIGPSGSGKSTLLRCCNRLEEPSAGEIWFEGVNLLAPGTDLNAMRRRIGMVFQSFNLYPHLSARDNVALALIHVLRQSRDEAHARAIEALRKVGLGDRGSAMPGELSGGQQQRVAIARALALEPAIVLFDEPTSALDPELVGSVLAVLRELRTAGMTMMVVSHEMNFARSAADRVVFMEGGRIIEQGPPAHIFGPDAPARIRDFVASVEHH